MSSGNQEPSSLANMASDEKQDSSYNKPEVIALTDDEETKVPKSSDEDVAGQPSRTGDQVPSASAPTTTPTTSTNKVPIGCDDNQNTDSNENFKNFLQSLADKSGLQRADKKEQDVEKFGGKIVYNPDGSAYIIDDNDEDDDPSIRSMLPRQEGSIIEKPGQDKPIVTSTDKKEEGDEPTEESPSYPQIANAFYVTRSAAYYNALYGQAYAKMLKEKMALPETPIVHSYRVYSKRLESQPPSSEPPQPLLECSTVPVKPILMCFLCKLSFGYASSFVNHCMTEHDIEPTGDEKESLDVKNCSAILQAIGKDKTPLLSFLEPVVKKDEGPRLSPNAIKGLLSAALTQQSNSSGVPVSSGSSMMPPTSTSLPPSDMLSPGMTARFPNLPPFPPLGRSSNQEESESSNKPPNNSFDLLSNLSQVPSTSSSSNMLLESLNLQSAMMRNTLDAFGTRRSPSSNNNGDISPSLISSQSPLPLPLPVSCATSFPSNANMLQGTTIGACPDHVNGRQTGVECSKCDMILNSSRMPGGLGWNAARNTCKTLKCPKCNWHYKYQETLEIHMKEKHPETETNCIYCVTGQQHPRLARGETYTCGYKPYRCEVCNYSTTTKGNLSIHMQSDKHLNNMQELQNGAVVAGPDGTKIPQSPLGRPGMPPLNLAALAKAKPSWRCDVCNYETNVARNLRIHMTSEKHTHNIMVIQQNVKHIQQLSQSGPGNSPQSGMFPPIPGVDPQQLLQMQMGMAPPGLPMANLPGEKGGQNEAAMADLAYLQAIMMQMMTGGQFPPGGPLPSDMSSPGLPSGAGMDPGLNPENMEPPPEPADEKPEFSVQLLCLQRFWVVTIWNSSPST